MGHVRQDVQDLTDKKTKSGKKMASPSRQCDGIQVVMDQVIELIARCKVHVKAFKQYAPADKPASAD